MPPKRSNTLTEAELRLMRLFWVRGESAVSELVDALPAHAPLAYTTVLTTVRILEKKGYLTHRQQGRAFLYSPCVGEHEARRSEMRHVLQRFFGNSREQLLLSVLGDADVTPAELERLKQALAEASAEEEQPAALEEDESR